MGKAWVERASPGHAAKRDDGGVSGLLCQCVERRPAERLAVWMACGWKQRRDEKQARPVVQRLAQLGSIVNRRAAG